MGSRRIFPHIAKNLYAVYIETQGSHAGSRPYGFFTSKKSAMSYKRYLLHEHAISLTGGQTPPRIIVVKYEREER